MPDDRVPVGSPAQPDQLTISRRNWPIHVHGARVAAAAIAVMCLVMILVLVRDAWTGLDLTDEGLYLLAADNHQPTAAANGWFGAYTGLLFASVGHDIGLFRIAGLVVLLACGALLGGGLVGVVRSEGVVLTGSTKVAIVLGAVAGELAFYSLYLRTPSYNWLALTGATLAAAGMLRQISIQPRDRLAVVVLAGGLIGVGCVLALWAKTTSGLGLAALALVLAVLPVGDNRRTRAHVALVAAAFAVLLLLLHAVFIADPVTTAEVLRRSAGWLAIVDPYWYSPATALWQAAGEVVRMPWWAVTSTFGLIMLALVPIALMVRRERSSPRLAGVVVVAVIGGTAILMLLRGYWAGGVEAFPQLGLAYTSVVVAALIAGVASWFAGRSRWNEEAPAAARLLGAGAVLLAAATLYALGSNNGLVGQMSGAGGLVLGAAALFGLIGVPRRWGARVLVGASVVVASVALLVVGTARMAPYRTASPDTASTGIEFGQRGSRLYLDAAEAAFWEAIQSTAPREGWRPSMRLLDLTWSPAVPYALGATVPETLATGFNQASATASAIEALRYSNAPLWRDAWVLVAPDVPSVRPAEVLESVGRRFPDDYTLVSQLVEPGRGLRVELWRPDDP